MGYDIEVPRPRTRWTKHGRERARARGIRRDAVKIAEEWGSVYRSGNCLVHRVDRNSIREAREMGEDISDFEGVIVVVNQRGAVCSAWKNRNPKRIRR
jgi:hypothetical protein